MDKVIDRKKEIIYRIVCSVLLFIVLFLSAVMLGKTGAETIETGFFYIPFGVSMLFFALLEGLKWIHKGKQDKLRTAFSISFISLYVISGVFSFLSALSIDFLFVSGLCYLFVFVLRRVVSIVFNHEKRNVILNVIIGLINLLVLFFGILSCFEGEGRELLLITVVGMVLLVSCLINAGIMAVSNFNYGLLKKIIKKTYAGEILFGLLLLIISFSIVFSVLGEAGIVTFSDALWYCFAIVTTIGFGDFAATSILGRILSVILGIYGIVVVAIVTSIIVNFYNEVKSDPDAKAETVTEKEEEKQD